MPTDDNNQNNQATTANNQQGTQNQDLGWRAALPDELKNHPVLSKYSKPGDFARDAIGWNERAEKGIHKPGDKATAAELSAYRAAMGIPETEDGYQLPEEVEGVKMSAERIKEFKALAHKLGIPADAAKALIEYDAKTAKAQSAAAEAAQTEQVRKAEDHFKQSWGTEYERNKELAERGIASLPPALQAKAINNGWVNDVDFVDYCLTIGKSTKEASTHSGRQAGNVPKDLASRMYPHLTK